MMTISSVHRSFLRRTEQAQPSRGQAFTLRRSVISVMAMRCFANNRKVSGLADNQSRADGSAAMPFLGTIMARTDGVDHWHKAWPHEIVAPPYKNS